MLYIRIKYPFWCSQPVLHTYDVFRFWSSVPYIIQSRVPLKSRYLDNQIITIPFLDTPQNNLSDVVELLQAHYVESASILTEFTKTYVETDMVGYTNPVYLSYKYEYNIGNNNVMIGCMTSRAIKMFVYTNKCAIEEWFTYYFDYICIHRDFIGHSLGHSFIESHERYQRCNNQTIQSSLFKKEISLCSGVVPVTQFRTYTFEFPVINRQPLSKFTVIQIEQSNAEIVYDVLYNITHDTKNTPFSFCAFPEITVLDNLIKTGQIVVYVVKYKTQITGVYFFKDTKLSYEDVKQGDTKPILEFMGSIMVTQSKNAHNLFFGGFLQSLHDFQRKHPKFKLLLFPDIAHNRVIIDKWKFKYQPRSITETAYYLYNMVIPKMPLNNNQCFICV